MFATLPLFWMVLQCFSILTEAQTCRGLSQYSPCSSNPDCGCLRFTSSSDESGICAHLHWNGSALRTCHEISYYCDLPSTVCVHHPNLDDTEPLCYPTGMASRDLCPPLTSISTSTPSPPELIIEICEKATWSEQGVTVAGSNGTGTQLQQLRSPAAIFVDPKDNSLFISDNGNNRIVKWTAHANSGVIVAGGNGGGNRIDQLGWVSDLLIDKKDGSLILCDAENHRVVRWPRNAQQGTILIDKIRCNGLALDDRGSLYVTEHENHYVTKWTIGENSATSRTIVAGGNGRGHRLDQLNEPYGVFVDANQTIYVTDFLNDRIVKWTEGAKEGTLIGHLLWPRTVLVDQLGAVYSLDGYYSLVMRWMPNEIQGTVIIDGRSTDSTESNILSQPYDLSFGQHGNLYVANLGNDRVEKFAIDKSVCL